MGAVEEGLAPMMVRERSIEDPRGHLARPQFHRRRRAEEFRMAKQMGRGGRGLRRSKSFQGSKTPPTAPLTPRIPPLIPQCGPCSRPRAPHKTNTRHFGRG